MTEWRDISGFEGRYQISNDGRVFSTPKLVAVGKNGGTTTRGGFELRQYKMKNGGHLRVYLSNSESKKVAKLVHRLVAETFINNVHNLPVVHHKDSNPENNHVSNLEWSSVGENTAYCTTRRIGNQKGEANSRAFLEDKTIMAIRVRFAECCNASQVAREFKISKRHAHSICHRKSWTHI